MPTAKKTPAKAKGKKQDDFERVTRWRFEALLELGLDPIQAVALIETPDVVHAAEKLAEKGCPPALIAILLEGG